MDTGNRQLLKPAASHYEKNKEKEPGKRPESALKRLKQGKRTKTKNVRAIYRPCIVHLRGFTFQEEI